MDIAFTSEQTAKIIGCTVTELNNLRSGEHITFTKVSERGVRFSRDDIAAYLESCGDPEDIKGSMTVADAAEALYVSVGTVYGLLDTGDLDLVFQPGSRTMRVGSRRLSQRLATARARVTPKPSVIQPKAVEVAPMTLRVTKLIAPMLEAAFNMVADQAFEPERGKAIQYWISREDLTALIPWLDARNIGFTIGQQRIGLMDLS